MRAAEGAPTTARNAGASPAADHVVVVNAEGEHALWPVHRDVPAGWARVGDAGTRDDCLRRIEALWVDMCPRSIRPSP